MKLKILAVAMFLLMAVVMVMWAVVMDRTEPMIEPSVDWDTHVDYWVYCFLENNNLIQGKHGGSGQYCFWDFDIPEGSILDSAYIIISGLGYSRKPETLYIGFQDTVESLWSTTWTVYDMKNTKFGHEGEE